MKRLILILVVIGVLAGCGAPKSKQDAYKQWHRARGQVTCQLADEQFKAGQLDDAHEKATEALQLDPELDAARLLLGKVYIEQDRYLDAINVLQELTVRQPKLPDGWYLLAVAQERSERLTDALESYNRCCELDAINTDAILARGEVMVALGNVAQAREAAESALKSHPKDPGLCEQAGRLAMMQEDYTSAAVWFQKAGDLDYRNLRYQESAALALMLDRQHVKALSILLSLTKSADYQPSALVHSMLGECYLVTSRYDEAQQAFAKACELDSLNPRHWCNAARAAMEAGDFAQAALDSGEALRLESYHHDASMLYGYALIRQGQTQQSLTFLRQAVRVHPDSGDLRCLLGRAYETTGDRSQAVNCYNQAVGMEPANNLAKQLLASANTTH